MKKLPMPILKNKRMFGRCIWPVIFFCGHLMAKNTPIDIRTYHDKVSVSTKKAPLDEVLFAVSSHCQLATSIREGDWPKVSLSIQERQCSEILSDLADLFHFQVISYDGRFDVGLSLGAMGHYHPETSSQVILDRMSKALIKKLGIIKISPKTIAYKKEFANMAIQSLRELDAPVESRKISYFIFSVDHASYYGFKSMIEAVFGQVYRKKGGDYQKMISSLVQQFSGSTNRKISMLAQPSLSVVIPGQSKWSGEMNMPHDKNKVLSDFQIQTKIDRVAESEYLFHVKLSFHVPIQSSRSFVNKVDKFESEVVVHPGEMVLLHGFAFNYSQKHSNASWWTPLVHFFTGGDAISNKLWLGVWALIE